MSIKRSKEIEREEKSQIHFISDHFDVLSELGSGAFGTVYKCLSKTDGNTYAVKAVPKIRKKGNNAMSIEKVRNEIRIMASLQHPNVVRIKEPVLTSDTHIYIVMELCEGGELLQKLKERRRFSEPEARMVMRKLLGALTFLHEQNVVHRDIKLENILLRSTNDLSDIKITDFGLSEAMSKEHVLDGGCGSPHYMAPEVIDPNQHYDEKCDMWSVGVVMFLLLTGERPFKGPSPGVFAEISKGEYKYPEGLTISDSAKHLIDHLLVVKAQERYTAAMALDHPWLTGNSAAAPAKTLQEVMNSYRAQQRFLRLARAVALCEVLMLASGFQKTKKKTPATPASVIAPSSPVSSSAFLEGKDLRVPASLGPVRHHKRKFSCPNIGVAPPAGVASHTLLRASLSRLAEPVNSSSVGATSGTVAASTGGGSGRASSPARGASRERRHSARRLAPVSGEGKEASMPSFMRGTVASNARDGTKKDRRNSTFV